MSRSLSSIQDWDKNPGKHFVLGFQSVPLGEMPMELLHSICGQKRVIGTNPTDQPITPGLTRHPDAIAKCRRGPLVRTPLISVWPPSTKLSFLR